MALASLQLLVLRLMVLPLLSVAARLQSWSMTLTNFSLGLMFSTVATQIGGQFASLNLPERNGVPTTMGIDPETTREELLEALASELLRDAKPRVFH